jgi:hypothetical protein
LTSTVGGLGSARSEFAGPVAITVGRQDGAHTDQVTVADAHNGRLVQLRDQAGSLTWTGEQKHDLGVVTSLSTDHWGNVYATGPAGGVAKYTSSLKSVAVSMVPTHRPRGFHVPTVTVTDHRTGRRERTGEGRGIVVEEWDQGSGLRVMELGVEVRDPALAGDGSAAVDLFLTDQADLTVTLHDADSGDLVAMHRAGARGTGAQRVAFRAEDDAAGWPAGEYRLTVTAQSTYDDELSDEVSLTVNLARSGDPNLPRVLRVVGNVPNPFNPSTTIEFLVPAGVHENYSLNIYDVQGRLVRRLGTGIPAPGLQRVLWDGFTETGSPASSGLYLYRVVVGDEKASGKMVLLK